MAKTGAIMVAALCKWKSRGWGETKTTTYRWVVQADSRNWVLAFQRRGHEPVGEKFCGKLEHLAELFAYPAGLDPKECIEAVAQGLAQITGESLDLSSITHGKDSKGRDTSLTISKAIALDKHYKLDFAHLPHDGVYERLDAYGREGIEANARDYSRGCMEGEYTLEAITNFRRARGRLLSSPTESAPGRGKLSTPAVVFKARPAFKLVARK